MKAAHSCHGGAPLFSAEKPDWLRHPVAVPEKIFGLTLVLDFFDRCHSLASLYLPPAALGSLPTGHFLRAA